MCSRLIVAILSTRGLFVSGLASYRDSLLNSPTVRMAMRGVVSLHGADTIDHIFEQIY